MRNYFLPIIIYFLVIPFNLVKSQPPNNNCSGAIELANGGPNTINNISFNNTTSSNMNDGTCPFAGSGDLFYTITTDNDNNPSESITISAFPNGQLNLALYVYSACNGTILGCRNATGNGGSETLTINGLGSETVILRVDHSGNGINFSLNVEGSALPIKIKELHAIAKSDHNLIEWETTTEVNNSFQIVQKSSDTNNWVDLSIVESRGNDNYGFSYKVHDTNPYVITYYRINSVDYDGKYEFSKAVSVQRNDIKTDLIYPVRPNPVWNSAFLEIEAHMDDLISITILNSTGIEVMNTQHYVNKGTNTLEINMSELSNGIYLVNIKTSNKSSIQKFLKN